MIQESFWQRSSRPVESSPTLVLIDKNKEKCRELAREIDALVLNGDGTEPGMLEEAGAKEADALIASTESDALNMVIAILGKRCSIPKVIVKLNNIELRPTCKEIGIDHITSPTLSSTMEILSLLRGYDVLDFSLLIKGGIQLIEITPGDKAGKKLKDIGLPDGILLTGILRDDTAVIPRGNTKLHEKDILFILAENEEKTGEIEDIFGELRKIRRTERS